MGWDKHQYQILIRENQPGQPCPRSPSEERCHEAATVSMVKPGGWPRRRSPESSLWHRRLSQNALSYKTHFVLVLPDGSCGQQKAQEEERDRAAGNAQAKVKWVSGEVGGTSTLVSPAVREQSQTGSSPHSDVCVRPKHFDLRQVVEN